MVVALLIEQVDQISNGTAGGILRPMVGTKRLKVGIEHYEAPALSGNAADYFLAGKMTLGSAILHGLAEMLEPYGCLIASVSLLEGRDTDVVQDPSIGIEKDSLGIRAAYVQSVE